MPTPLKTIANIRKHLSKAERQSRQAAERNLQRSRRVTLKVPDWLSDDAKTIFQNTKKRLHGLDVLTSADADLLAMYSDAIARYQAGIKTLVGDVAPNEITAVQAWSRLALSYAEKLGISPTGRARLAKKKTEERPQDEMEALFAEVNEFTNDHEDHA